jgi:hypothetical protein
MGLFSRRTVNRLLQENRRFLPDDKVGLHINHLNGRSAVQRLTTEWEVAVLNGLAKFGSVRHEPKLSGKVSVDLLLAWKERTALIEVTTVSDRGLDEANPIEQLCKELIKILRERGLNADKFYVSVNGNGKELFLGGPKAQLCLPRPEKFHAVIFNAEFQNFLNKVKSLPQKLSFRVKVGSEADVTITFDPAQNSFGYTHLAYTVPFTIHSNPVYNRLKSKAGQLGKAGFEGIKGIILCDAGCQMLTRQGHWGLDLGGAEIISAFLKQEDSVGFIIVLSVESDGTHRLGPDHLRIVGKTYVNPRQRGSSPLFDDLCRELVSQLPRPETTPINGSDTEDLGRSFFGGGSVSGNKIKMSARTVVGVLAGQITSEEFLEENKLFAEHFTRMLRNGCTIAEVRIERTERDDDWIEFVFSDPDPAISPFRLNS